nr:DEAD/DEAH box helicase family protein [Angelakisella massiliensis]
MPTYRSASGSSAEDLFIELFSDTFGAEKAGYLYSQYPFSDIYQNSRFADFLIENGGRKVAIEIDDEASHNPKLVSQNKFCDDLLKQNSMIYLGWDVYRWAVRQIQQQPETVKDELRVFLGQHPSFKEIEDYLPTQRGKSLDGSQLELKEHQKQALAALEKMRCNFETIALLYHATGTGKTVTAVMDAKRFGKRTLFLAHTVELVDQATKTFRELWPRATVGRYVESMKQGNAFVVCGSIQSVALNLERFKPDDFGYAHTREECEEKLKVLIQQLNAEQKTILDRLRGVPSPEKLTKKQRQIWEYMKIYPDETNYSTIAKGAKVTRHTVAKHFEMIQKMLGP